MTKKKAEGFNEKRISIMNHDEKHREKIEVTKCADIIKAVDRPQTANFYTRKKTWITQEKTEKKIFTKPRLSTHSNIGTAANRLTSTDIDPTPQSIAFIRSSSVFSPKGRNMPGTVQHTPKFLLSKQHPSNAKFSLLKSEMVD